MPTRKISEREKLTTYARTASDDELATALEIFQIESRVRTAAKAASKKPAGRKAETVPTVQRVPGPPNPPKPTNDNPQG